MKPQTLTLASRLDGLLSASIKMQTVNPDPAQQKKQARMAVSLKKSTSTTGFLHAALARIGEHYFLFAGQSGIGKSSYVQSLQQSMDVEVLANDWVAVQQQNTDLVASDLNFKENIVHGDGCKLTGVIFLTHGDRHARDAYVPNKHEFIELLSETFDTATSAQLKKLSNFWIAQRDMLPFVAAVPTRIHSEAYTAQTIKDILGRATRKTTDIEVGIIGVGDVGSLLAYQLGQLPFVSKVHIYNQTVERGVGFALDINHGLHEKEQPVVIAHTTPEAVFRQASTVFITFRETRVSPITKTHIHERWTKLTPHLHLTKQYVDMAASCSFGGDIFVVTNPVDPLTYAWYKYSQHTGYPLRTYQVYGVGLELDVLRAAYYASEARIPSNNLTAYGNHADKVVIGGAEGKSTYLEKKIAQASPDVRARVPRTVYGPVSSAIQSFTSYVQGKSSHITLIEDEVFIGHRLGFRGFLPERPANLDQKILDRLIAENKNTVANITKAM